MKCVPWTYPGGSCSRDLSQFPSGGGYTHVRGGRWGVPGSNQNKGQQHAASDAELWTLHVRATLSLRDGQQALVTDSSSVVDVPIVDTRRRCRPRTACSVRNHPASTLPRRRTNLCYCLHVGRNVCCQGTVSWSSLFMPEIWRVYEKYEYGGDGFLGASLNNTCIISLSQDLLQLIDVMIIA